MQPQRIVLAIAEHWGEMLRYLEPGDVADITAALRRLEAAPNEEAESVGADIADIVIRRLPAGHPVRELIAGQLRLAPGRGTAVAEPAAWTEILRLLRDVPDLDLGGDEVTDADSWLLNEPALTEAEVRGMGVNPYRSDLIRLQLRAGQIVLPAFQFGAAGTPVPVVTAVNCLLAVYDDPIGVADWWLGRNAWLGGVPARLIGRVTDDLLVRAARAELAED